MHLCEFLLQNTCFPRSFSCAVDYLRWKSCKQANFLQARVVFFSLGFAIVLREQFFSGLIESHICNNSCLFLSTLLLLKPSLLPLLLASVLTDSCFLCISYLSRKIRDFYTLTAVTFAAGRNIIPAALTHHISFMLCLLFLVLHEIIFFFWLILQLKCFRFSVCKISTPPRQFFLLFFI